MAQPGSIAKWLDPPAAHIATAGFISAGMLIALGIKLILHRETSVNAVLLVAILGALIPLLIAFPLFRNSPPGRR